MSFFSSDVFLESAAAAFFPRRCHAVETVRVADGAYRLLVVGRAPVTTLPFLDFVEPLCGAPAARRTHGFLPRAVRGVVPAARWAVDGLAARYEPSPYVEWSTVGSWDGFVAAVKARSHLPFAGTARKRRRMQREIGPMRIQRRDDDRALVELCMTWKSAQYRRSHYVDLFALPGPRELFFELQRRGALWVTALHAGSRTLAVNVGVLWEGRAYYWLQAYDLDARELSAGTLLLDELLRESHGRDQQFDFLIGDEPYKWFYATHTRLVGPAGERPLPERLWLAARALGVAGLRREPRVHALASALKRRWMESGLRP